MRFVYPWILMLFPVLPLLAVVWFILRRKSFEKLAGFVKIDPRLPTLERMQGCLLFAGLLLLLVAAARPQWGKIQERQFVKSRNVVIAIDVSRSMLAADVHPNRLERSKADVLDLINELKGDRAALLAFRKKGVLLCPLTTDYGYLRQALDGLSPDSAPRGETDIGDAVYKSLEALEPAMDHYNAILLISDGDDLSNSAKAAAEIAAKRGVPVFTVGIGSEAGAEIPAEGGDSVKYKTQTVKTKLTESTLAEIAKISGGRYIPLATAGTAHTTLGSIYRGHLRRIAEKEQQELQQEKLAERYQWFLIPAILFLVASLSFSRGRLKTGAALLVGLLWGTAVCGAQNGREGAREAQSFYRIGNYTNSAAAYLAAAKGVERAESETYRYNAAMAYWKAGDVSNAVQTLEELTLSPEVGAKAADLLGKLRFEAAAAQKENPEEKYGLMKSAAEAVQTAVRAQPNDPRGRNLTRAVSPLTDLETDARIAAVLKAHGKSSPDQLADAMLKSQRELHRTVQSIFTNAPAIMIARAEEAAKKQSDAADLWIALKKGVLDSPGFTNEQQRAEFSRRVEPVRDAMNGAALGLKDILPESAGEVQRLEGAVYPFWKAFALPPALTDEGIALQSNAWRQAANLWEGRTDQEEALELTLDFQKKFPEWAKQMEQQVKANTNMPPFTAEIQAEIARLAEATQQLQVEACRKNGPVRATQWKALANLLKIRDLLPKNPNQQNQQNQQQQQQQKQDQQQNQQQQQKDEQKQEQKKQEEQSKPDEKPQDVQNLLQRALEREREHEDDKKRQMRQIPLRPDERDW